MLATVSDRRKFTPTPSGREAIQEVVKALMASNSRYDSLRKLEGEINDYWYREKICGRISLTITVSYGSLKNLVKKGEFSEHTLERIAPLIPCDAERLKTIALENNGTASQSLLLLLGRLVSNQLRNDNEHYLPAIAGLINHLLKVEPNFPDQEQLELSRLDAIIQGDIPTEAEYDAIARTLNRNRKWDRGLKLAQGLEWTGKNVKRFCEEQDKGLIENSSNDFG